MRPVVGVKTQQLKRQRSLHPARRRHHSRRPLVPRRPVNCPSTVDVAIGHAPHEVPSRLPPQCATVSASRYPDRVMSQLSVRIGICVLRSPPGLVPQRPRWPTRDLRPASSRSACAALIDKTRLRRSFPSRPRSHFVVREPMGQQRLEPFATGLLGHLPNPPQHLLLLAVVLGRTPLARAGVATPAGFGTQPIDGVFAAVAPLFGEFINEARTPLATPSHVAQSQARQQFFGNLSAHRHPFRLPASSFLSQRLSPATPGQPFPVSKLLRQQAEEDRRLSRVQTRRSWRIGGGILP